jgi:hypothetical protein
MFVVVAPFPPALQTVFDIDTPVGVVQLQEAPYKIKLDGVTPPLITFIGTFVPIVFVPSVRVPNASVAEFVVNVQDPAAVTDPVIDNVVLLPANASEPRYTAIPPIAAASVRTNAILLQKLFHAGLAWDFSFLIFMAYTI